MDAFEHDARSRSSTPGSIYHDEESSQYLSLTPKERRPQQQRRQLARLVHVASSIGEYTTEALSSANSSGSGRHSPSADDEQRYPPVRLPFHPPPPPPAPLPQYATISPSFLVHAEPFRGSKVQSHIAAVKPSRHERTRDRQYSQPPPLDQVRHLIVPDRESDPYFMPQSVDTPCGSDWGTFVSWSFFPHPALHGKTKDEEILEDRRVYAKIGGWSHDLAGYMKDKRIVPLPDPRINPLESIQPTRVGSGVETHHAKGRKTGTDFTPRSRPKRSYAGVVQDPITRVELLHANENSAKRRRTSEDVKPAIVDGECGGRLDASAGPSTITTATLANPKDGLLGTKDILRASKRIAQQRSGRSIGVEFWKERLRFEKRGMEPGEHSLGQL